MSATDQRPNDTHVIPADAPVYLTKLGREALAAAEARAEHRERHALLHRHLDELLADFIRHTGRMPSRTPLSEFLSWSFAQSIEPTEVPNG